MILRLWLLVVLTLAGAFAPSRAGARTAETRTGDFFAATANARPESAPQVVETHLGNLVCGYELAPGYSQAAETVTTQSAGQLVSANVRAFMRGEKALTELTATERAQAIRGFEQAAQNAKNAADAAYQQARAAALRGEGSPPGSIIEWRKNFKQ